MTDKGVSFRSHRYAKALRMLNIKHKRTKPYTPKTKGRRSASSRHPRQSGLMQSPTSSSAKGTESLTPFLHHYNYHRPHFGIKGYTTCVPVAPKNNLLTRDI